jgi:uncharacterized membrane protein
MTSSLALFEFENVERTWLWLLLVAAGVWLLGATYRQVFERSEQRLTWGLLALRLVGVISLLLALSHPTWTHETREVDPGRVAIVVDDSLSMSLAGPAGQSRFAAAKNAVEALRTSLDVESSNRRVQIELFDLRGEPIEKGKLPVEPKAERTDLVRAVSNTVAHLRSKLLTSVVLISDGVDNTGRPDTLQLADLPVPIFCVGFPNDSTSSQMDLALKEATAPAKALVNNEIKVTVTVAKTSGPTVSGNVILKRGADEVARQEVSFAEGNDEQRVEVPLTPTEAGRFVYTAVVSTDAGERMLANNAKHFSVQVAGEPIRVFYAEGFLRYEYKFLKSRLEDDPDVSLVSIVRRVNPQRLDDSTSQSLLTEDRLKSFDLVILGDIDSDEFTAAEYDLLSRWVGDGKALLVLGGYHSFGPDGLSKTPLADVLPVNFAGKEPRQTEEPFALQLTERGLQHPSFEIVADRVKNAGLWNAAPVLLGAPLVKSAKPGAEVLAVNPNVQFDNQPAVMIATQRYGKGATMVVAPDTTWRWSRLPRVVGQSDTLYSRFWSQTIRWLTGRDLDQKRPPLVVSTNRPDYKVGQEVIVRVTHQADEGQAAGDVAVEVVTESGQRTNLPLRASSASPDSFSGSFYPSAGGRFEVQATLTAAGQPAANQRTEFVVHGSDLELSQTETNRSLLQAIAERSGGLYADIDQAAKLSERIPRKQRTTSRFERTEFWNSPWLFLFFLATISAEWVIRRRNHLV